MDSELDLGVDQVHPAHRNAARPIDWEALYADLLPRVYNFCRYRVGDGPEAEDLTAATFERAWRERGRYRRDRGAFTTWLFTIARNLAIDHFRRQRPTLSLEDARSPDALPSPEECAQQQDELARLGALLARLEARERELAALKYGAGLTNRSIAQLTGLSESNVGTILYRVVHQLREQWKQEE